MRYIVFAVALVVSVAALAQMPPMQSGTKEETPISMMDLSLKRAMQAWDDSSAAAHVVLAMWIKEATEKIDQLTKERDYWRAWAGYK